MNYYPDKFDSLKSKDSVELQNVSPYTIFFKQLGSGLSPQSRSYFQGFQVSKLLNGLLVVLPSNLRLRGIQ